MWRLLTTNPNKSVAVAGRSPVIAVALGLLAALAWAATCYQSQTMVCGMCDAMSVACPMCMGTGKPLMAAMSLFMLMWATMMAAMMLPSIAPMVMLFDQVSRRRRESGGSYVQVGVFVAGYMAAWVLSGIAAFAAVKIVQWGLGVAPALHRYNEPVAGATLVIAGLYQWSPLKHGCLKHCQSPLMFVLQHWRDGRAGAMLMGLKHGLFCIGCCWGLMLVLFAVGLMNLAWMAGLAVVMSVEKISGHGAAVGKAAGLFLLGAGALLLLEGYGRSQ